MDMKRIGTLLKELRRSKGLTQEQLAEELGVAGRTVSRWETGANMPDISLLILISDFYGIGLDEILDGERKSEKMDREQKEILTKVADYSKEQQERSFKNGNKAFSIAYVTCAIAIIVQLLVFADIKMVAGETVVLGVGGMVYLIMTIHNGTWETSSFGKRTVLNDSVLSILLSAAFSLFYAGTIYRKSNEPSLANKYTVLFFVGTAIGSFLVLRILAWANKKMKHRASAKGGDL